MKNIAALPAHQLTSRVVGVPPSARLLQSPAFPNGEADGQALVVLARASGCLVPGEPGTLAWVNGHVRSAFAEILPGLPPPNEPLDDDQSAAIPVKLRIERCGFAGPTLIDSDSALVVAAGQTLNIEVVAPTGWVRWSPDIRVSEGGIYQFVQVDVTACAFHLGSGRGSRLTYFAVLDDDDVVVRPRRARTLMVNGPNTGGTQWELDNGDPTGVGGAVPVGFFAVNGGFVNTPAQVGAASHLQLLGGGGTATPIGMTWEID